MESDIWNKQGVSLMAQVNSSYKVIVTNDSESDTNFTQMDPRLVWDILSQDKRGLHFTETTDIVFVTCFAALIIIGALGNGLVCYVVVKNAHMRTPRNIFIINLAISDLTLCLFTQPLNLYRLLNTQWLLGGYMCKFVAMCQGTNVFVSTISITAIALDRFQVIVYPTKDSMKKLGAASALCSIWIISFFMSSPLLIFSIYKIEQPVPGIEFYFYRCLEDITLMEEKGAYSVASMVVQYILPIVIVTIAHARICNKLKYRMVNQGNSAGNRTNFQKRKNERQSRRKRRTSITLSLIAIVFALSWLPLNLFNILTEFQFSYFKKININLAYKICHMLVLSSACTNPLIYGWLNDNFRVQFVKVLSCCICCVKLKAFFRRMCCCCCTSTQGDVPVIVFTKESTDNNGTVTHVNHNQLDGNSVTGLQSITDVNSHRSQVSL